MIIYLSLRSFWVFVVFSGRVASSTTQVNFFFLFKDCLIASPSIRERHSENYYKNFIRNMSHNACFLSKTIKNVKIKNMFPALQQPVAKTYISKCPVMEA